MVSGTSLYNIFCQNIIINKQKTSHSVTDFERTWENVVFYFLLLNVKYLPLLDALNKGLPYIGN